MAKERLYLFDTTLRDGAQTQGVDFSVEDKIIIAKTLDKLGIDYIEGGWPGANPGDTAFFDSKPTFKNSTFTAFGMTRRPGRSASNDSGLKAVLDAETPASEVLVQLVGRYVAKDLEAREKELKRRMQEPDADLQALLQERQRLLERKRAAVGIGPGVPA